MALSAGDRLGPYEILAPIGAGGMGEVYRAEDTRLKRVIALKTLKERFTERFEREARAIAALNHPHICTLHDIGTQDGAGYLVMEYIDGKPVKGPLKIADALRLAIQIASALEAAHERGILHRDLKPANILVTKSGVKLLDFGLAKFAESEKLPVEVTITAPVTRPGQILGTLGYMAPEQIEGRPADARSDIFSFGLVLYEMLTGRRAFQASSQAGLMAAILKEEPPPLTSLQPSIPPLLERTVKKCLAKEPGSRWQTATDLRDELTWIAESDAMAAPPVSRRALLPWIAGAAVGAATVGAAVWGWSRQKSFAPPSAIRFRLEAPEGAWPQRIIEWQTAALSPVGSLVARVATGERGPMIWVQRLDSLKGYPLAGTEGATMVFWSHDGRSIGFWAGGKLKKVLAEGGTPLPICDLPGPNSATWNQEGSIIATTAGTSWLIAVSSGTRTQWKPVRWPKFLPDGKHVLYTNLDQKTAVTWAYVEDFATGRQTALMPTDTQVVFAPDEPGSSLGYLISGRGATLLAQRFDAGALRLSGEPVPVAEEVPFFQNGWSEFDASPGVLIYSIGSQTAQLTWLDRGGRKSGTLGGAQHLWAYFRLSPDGRKVASVFDIHRGNTDIWVYDVSTASAERVTFEPGGEYSPIWSPDGTQLAFGSSQGGQPQLRTKVVTDHGPGEDFAPGTFRLPSDWSPDGRWILYVERLAAKAEIWAASVADRKSMPVVQAQFICARPALSPNQEYLAFSSDETGRQEIYVQRLVTGGPPKVAGERIQISHGGGRMAHWRRDSTELFFVSSGNQLMAAAVHQGGTPAFDIAKPLFRMPLSSPSMSPEFEPYDVSADGQKFLVPIREAAGASLQVVVNWQPGLKTGVSG